MPVVEQLATASIVGHSTYRLSVCLNPDKAGNIYAIFGDTSSALRVPAAYARLPEPDLLYGFCLDGIAVEKLTGKYFVC